MELNIFEPHLFPCEIGPKHLHVTLEDSDSCGSTTQMSDRRIPRPIPIATPLFDTTAALRPQKPSPPDGE